MQRRARRRIHFNNEEGSRITYDYEEEFEEFYGSLDATEVASSRPLKRWVHLIPVMVILCFIILWWLHLPAKVVVKDGRMESVLHTEIPCERQNDLTNHTPLEDATSPVSSNFAGFANNNEDEASTDSTWTLRNPTDSKPTGNGSPAPDIKSLEFLEVLYN